MRLEATTDAGKKMDLKRRKEASSRVWAETQKRRRLRLMDHLMAFSLDDFFHEVSAASAVETSISLPQRLTPRNVLKHLKNAYYVSL